MFFLNTYYIHARPDAVPFAAAILHKQFSLRETLGVELQADMSDAAIYKSFYADDDDDGDSEEYKRKIANYINNTRL